VRAQWALDNPGAPGVVGADVGALAAWTITKGMDEVRVAILDEGVDTSHPFLKPAIVAEADFVDGHATAMPDGDDAHGTACAGIVASRNQRVSGLAPGVSLVAARIAKGGPGYWIFDDFETADAIDWCWDTAKADVLSNSWGGGAAAMSIARAIERARTNGRQGRGAVVVAAAGNDQLSEVSFPARLDGVIAVGATNQWDKRKTRTSEDAETNWGSNYGVGLSLMAPGVAIATTDISGNHGMGTGKTTTRFNGTSAATPFIAATAALMLSVAPALTEKRVRELLEASADPLGQTRKWRKETGHGRVDAYSAVRAARRG
jgi:subtilisin family serine protease